MQSNWLRSAVALLVLLAIVAVPAFALRGPNAPTDSDTGRPVGAQTSTVQQPVGAETDARSTTAEEAEEADGEGRCHGIQRAYWAVTGNPGRGEGKAEAAAELKRVAAERGCELAEASADGWHGGPPPWAGKAEGRAHGKDRGPRGAGDGDDEGRGRPAWARDGDGPPWGLAWGHWLRGAAEGDVCRRIADRMQAHHADKVPAGLRERIESKLGCELP